jgi:hypothetical protein
MFGPRGVLSYADLRKELSVCLSLLEEQIPDGVEAEMDDDADGFVSAENVTAWTHANIDWYTGQQAMSKMERSPTLFDSARVLFAVFGFDYAQPFTRMNIVGSYSIGMGYLLLLSKPIDSTIHARNQAEGENL